MVRLIDAEALNAEMYHKSFEVDDGRNVWNSGLWIRYKIFEEAIRDAPTVEPTLYGYKIEHLALIARVMQKDGVTPEQAVQTFKDVQTIVLKVIDEISEAIERAFKQAMEADHE